MSIGIKHSVWRVLKIVNLGYRLEWVFSIDAVYRLAPSLALVCIFMPLPYRISDLLRRAGMIKHRRVPQPTRLRRALRPMIGSLEARLVLNATAELNAAGQLFVVGDSADDIVHLEVNAADQLRLRDGSGAIIPIAGHPGVDTEPLNRSAITSNQLIVDLGGGDDVLSLQIPSGLDVTVVAGSGDDSTALLFQSSANSIVAGTLDISSDEIRIESSLGRLDFRSATVQLVGDVVIGTPDNATILQFNQSSVTIAGQLAIAGDASLLIIDSEVDLSDTVLTATAAGNDLRITADNGLVIGSVDDSGGSRIQDFSVDAAQSVSVVGETLAIDGRLSIVNVAADVVVDADVNATAVNIVANGNVTFDGAVFGSADLTATAGQTVSFIGSVELSGNLISTGTNPTEIFASSIQATGFERFNGGVSFLDNGTLTAADVNLGEVSQVASNVTYAINAPVSGSDLRKTGDGTLILSANNLYTGQTIVEAGALRVDGSTAVGAGPVRIVGGRLEGSGLIRSNVITSNDSSIDPGPRINTLTVAGLNLASTSTADFQFRGTTAGSGYDQLVVSNATMTGSVQLGSALLRLAFDANAEPATEYVLIRNDGTDDVTGTFTAAFAVDGSPLASPRTLLEGGLVLNNFGGSGRPAFITYAGGDGNDVAIVTAGDVNIDAGNVTLIQRRGSNLEIRTGSDFPTAQAAIPTIRPFAAINDYQVRINGSRSDQALFVDINNFVDPRPEAIQYTGEIVFTGGGPNDNDSITLLDLNPITSDVPESVLYSFDSVNSGNIRITTLGSASQFDILFTQTESITQSVAAPVVQLQYSDLAEQITISTDEDVPSRTLLTSSTSGAGRLSVSIENPTQRLAIFGGGGDDNLLVTGFGNGGGGFAASLTIDGQGGADAIVIEADLTLGRGSVKGDLNVLAESIAISGDINTTGGIVDGQINLVGGNRISIEQSSVVNSGDAAINVDAATGRFTSIAGRLVSIASDDAVTISNASDVQLGDVDTPFGRLSIETDTPTGNVSQALGTRIIANRMSIDAAGSVTLANVENDFRLIENVLTGGAIAINDSVNDLDILRIDSRSNDVTINAIGTIGLAAGGIVASGAVANLTAGVAIIDNREATDGTAANIAAGIVNLVSGTGGIGAANQPLVIAATQRVNANSAASHSDIVLASPAITLPIGLIDAGRGAVTLNALSIQDANNDEVADIIANRLLMTAETGIGNLQKLELQQITELSATTGSGGIRLDHSSIQNPTITLLQADTGPIEVQHTGSTLLTIQRIESGNGNVTIVHQGGSIEVVGDGTSTESILAGADGSVTLTALGATSDVALRDNIRTSLGDVILSADQDVSLNAAGDVETSGGSVFITADARVGDLRGAITMEDGAIVNAATGRIELLADGDIVLGRVQSQNANDAIRIVSVSGLVRDTGDMDQDIIAADGLVSISSLNGIGVDKAIETSIARLTAEVLNVGSIQIIETDAIVLQSVQTTEGLISISATGTITATSVSSLSRDFGGPSNQDGSSRDITLTATGETSDILVGNISALKGADVFLTAGDDVLDTDPADDHRIIADDLSITALNANTTETDNTTAIRVTTNINDLVFTTSGNLAGDVFITEVDSINLAASDTGSDDDRLVTSNGKITINAGVNIVVMDNDARNDNSVPASDVEIKTVGLRGDISLTAGNNVELTGAVQLMTSNGMITINADSDIVLKAATTEEQSADALGNVLLSANGANGTIALDALMVVELADATRLEASQTDTRSIFVTAPDVVLGAQIELNTGAGVGIARWFSLRPMPGLEDTAFFDFTTIQTSPLTQEGANDASGILSFLVGRPGETGFTIDIDWGDSANRRFQSIPDQPGGQIFSQSHVFLEEDILDSRLNGRTSATDAFQVLFSVSHHPSILVEGNTILQSESEADRETVTGRLLSSTDMRPLLPVLENGTASFRIPNLTIPVAFFPVRQIIPETFQPEVFVRVESSKFVASGTVESKSTSATSAISRDEYFQIRVLSLEPGGDDLAAPQRLPDDILAGDNLKKLYAELPDGKYEIQYVLGDDNKRMLLRFDLRNHEPIVPGDALDGGQLELPAIELEKILRELEQSTKEIAK